MNFKIDTKEKMHVIRLPKGAFSDHLAEELATLCNSYRSTPVKNVVLDFEAVESVQQSAIPALVTLQELFSRNKASLVFCQFQTTVKEALENEDALELLNVTPTESEAWDIVQMEEIERELFED